jgi:hypothetical protein
MTENQENNRKKYPKTSQGRGGKEEKPTHRRKTASRAITSWRRT